MAFSKIYLTDCDTDVTYPTGPRWLSRTVRIEQETSRYAAHWKRGNDVDSCVLVLMPRKTNDVTGASNPDTIGSTAWVTAARAGALDGCTITIYRAYFSTWPAYAPVITPTGILTIFVGRIAEVDITDTVIAITLNDYRELLTQKLPRNLFQSPCRFTLFDFGCQLAEASYAVAGTVQTGSTQAVIISSAIVPGGSGTFELGKIEMTSGLNIGFRRTVKSWVSATNTLSVLNPFPFAIAAGDTFSAYPGCNKTMATCTAFGNILNYGGQPYIPDATTAL